MEKAKQKDLFAGSLTRNILLYTLPIIATGILQLLFNTADLVVVGQFDGSGALAAVGSTSALINLIVNLLIGLSVGSAVIVAQAWGARDREAIGRGVHTAMAVSLIGGVLVGIIGALFGGDFLRWMDTDAAVIADATLYIRIYFIGVPAGMVYNFGAAILRAAGNTKVPLAFLSIAGVVNILLNLLLVAGFQMGVAGVAIATSVSQLVSAVLVVIYMMKSRTDYRFQLRRLAIHKKELIRMMAIGIPAGLQGSLFSISNVIIQSSVNSFANMALVAGNTAAMTIEGFVYTLMNSFSNAAMTFVGQTVGAERYDRIPKVAIRCLLLVTGVGVGAGVLVYLFRSPLLNIFAASEDVNAAAAASYGAIRLLYICVPYFLCGLMDVLTGILRGMGSSTLPMIITIGGVCGLRILWIYTVFAANHTLEILYFSYPLSWVVTAVAQMILYIVVKRRLFRRVGLAGKAVRRTAEV